MYVSKIECIVCMYVGEYDCIDVCMNVFIFM